MADDITRRRNIRTNIDAMGEQLNGMRQFTAADAGVSQTRAVLFVAVALLEVADAIEQGGGGDEH